MSGPTACSATAAADPMATDAVSMAGRLASAVLPPALPVPRSRSFMSRPNRLLPVTSAGAPLWFSTNWPPPRSLITVLPETTSFEDAYGVPSPPKCTMCGLLATGPLWITLFRTVACPPLGRSMS